MTGLLYEMTGILYESLLIMIWCVFVMVNKGNVSSIRDDLGIIMRMCENDVTTGV